MKAMNDKGELIHIDSSFDVIQHYGKKGMKWGFRSSLNSIKKRWNNLPERRRKQIKFAAKTAGYAAGIVGYHYTKGKLDPYIRAQIVKRM